LKPITKYPTHFWITYYLYIYYDNVIGGASPRPFQDVLHKLFYKEYYTIYKK